MSFQDDCLEPDDTLIVVARERLQRSSPTLSDEQFAAWLARVRASGARLELTPDGVRASYERGKG